MKNNKKKKIPQLPPIAELPELGKIPVSYNGVTYYVLASTLMSQVGTNLKLEDLIDELTPQEGDTLVYINNEWVVAPAGTDVFDEDFILTLSGTKSFGKYTNGQTVPAAGKTAREVILDAAVEYLLPAVSSFSISGQATTLETGERITGSKTFNWAFTNSSNVAPNTVSITDTTNATVLASSLANDGTEVISLPSDVVKNTPGQSNVWTIAAQNTNLGNFSGNFSVIWRNKMFYGPNSTQPTDSTTIRALATNQFYSGGTTFLLNTGSTLNKFYVAIPASSSITSVVDLDALNAVITSQYVLLGTFTVDDVATPTPNSFSYKLYEMVNAVPYSSNHRHSITIS